MMRQKTHESHVAEAPAAVEQRLTAYPLLFHAMLKERVWGGEALLEFGKPVRSGQHVGESWELADLPESIPDGRSIITNGPLAGLTLRQAIAAHGRFIMGDGALTAEGGFPLLIKFLDARENLSVQVHPTAEYVRRHPQTHLKSEAWVVLRAAPGAVIYSGLKPEVTATDLKAHIAGGDVAQDLVAVPARVGDCLYLPSGTCHALGAGVVAAEMQTPSDTTFRVFDWERTASEGGGGRGRELHIAQALECIRFGLPAPRPATPPPPIEVDGVRTTRLLATDHFNIERIDAIDDGGFAVSMSGLPEVWMMIDGRGVICPIGSEMIELSRGMTMLLPAALQGAQLRLSAEAWLLRVTLPSPLKGLIATT
jgi:mannose-6-phosphate isomerase